MITNICSCLQRTQIKLENVRAKNVKGNAHTLWFLLSSTNVSRCPGHRVSCGASSGSPEYAADAPKEPIVSVVLDAGSFQKAPFQRLELRQIIGVPGHRSPAQGTLRGLKPRLAKRSRATQKAPRSQFPRKGGAGLWLRRNHSLCQMISFHPATITRLYSILRPILTCSIEFLAEVPLSIYLFD